MDRHVVDFADRGRRLHFQSDDVMLIAHASDDFDLSQVC